MTSALSAFAAGHRPGIEAELRRRMPRSTLAATERLNQAVEYAVSSGGKRSRPLLTLIAAGVGGMPSEAALAIGCGVEFLHLASLIFDDLPAMDDAPTRRHLPTVHVAFGESLAILAALALYARAFELFADLPALAKEAAHAAGSEGMTGGQAADLEGAVGSRMKKTTALIRLALSAGGIAAGCGRETLRALTEYGELVGEAYQLCDDLLDALAGESLTGKTGGQDRRHGRHALTREFGAGNACARVDDLVRRAIEVVRQRLRPCLEAELLCEFADSLARRAADLVESYGADHRDGRAAGPGGGQCDPVAPAESVGPDAGRERLDPDPRS